MFAIIVKKSCISSLHQFLITYWKKPPLYLQPSSHFLETSKKWVEKQTRAGYTSSPEKTQLSVFVGFITIEWDKSHFPVRNESQFLGNPAHNPVTNLTEISQPLFIFNTTTSTTLYVQHKGSQYGMEFPSF